MAANAWVSGGEAHAVNIMGITGGRGGLTMSERSWQDMKRQEGRIRKEERLQMTEV